MKKTFLNKKGESIEQGYTPLHLIMALFIFVIMGFILYMIFTQYIDAFLVYDKDIPRNIYAYRAINTCLAYQDPFTDRFYPGIIDSAKYNQKTLDQCYKSTQYKSFNIQLVDLSSDTNQYPRILVGFGAALTIKNYPVLIRNSEGNLVKGELLFGMSESTTPEKGANK